MRVLVLLALVSNVVLATPSTVSCVGERGTKIEVLVDFLESNPPQSQVSITRFGEERDGYAAFTEHVVIEIVGGLDQYTWKDRNGFRSVTVETVDGKTGNGFFSVGRMLPENLNCELN